MKYEIVKTVSRSGRRPMWYPTISDIRLSRTNYARKWEAEALLRSVRQRYTEAEIAAIINKVSSK